MKPIVELASLLQGARFEFQDDLRMRHQEHPILPICRACANPCKVHGATGLIMFVCHDFSQHK